MTGHRPDQPGTQDPSDSASQNAGADVSADEFAAALKLIVTRLEGQDDGAESSPAGSDVEPGPAAVPPSGVLNAPSEAPREDTPWTGLLDTAPSDPPPVEPDAPSPLSGGPGSASTGSGGATTAADLWPASSPRPEPSNAPATASDPLFAEPPAPSAEPESSPMPVAEDPLFASPSGEEGGGSREMPPITGSVFGDSVGGAEAAASDPLLAESAADPTTNDLLNTPVEEDVSPSGNDQMFGEALSESSDPSAAAMEMPAGDGPEAAAATAPDTGPGPDTLFSPEPDTGLSTPQDDPLFAEKPAGGSDALASPPADDGSADKEPLFAEPQPEAGGTDPLSVPPPPAEDGGKEPLFADISSGSGGDDAMAAPSSEPAESGKEPLFADTGPSGGADDALFAESGPGTADVGKEPLFADTGSSDDGGDALFAESGSGAADVGKEPLFVDTGSTGRSDDALFAEAGSGTSEPPAEPPAKEPLFVDMPTGEASDPMAGLRNTDTGPTIGPAMPAPDTMPESGAAETPPISEPLFADSTTPVDEPTPQPAEPPPAEAEPSDSSAGLGGAADDPFASAARPAFEDERANALFGDTPDLAAQNAPGSSLGPIGAEAEDFGKDAQSDAADDRASGPTAPQSGASDDGLELVATRDLDDDPEANVELDEILPPLDPDEAASLEKAAGPPKPKRSLNLGAPVFWLLILGILGGISYWGYHQRDQFVAVGDWAQATYALPTGQLAALLPFNQEPGEGGTAPAPAVDGAPPAPEAAAVPDSPVPSIPSEPQPAAPPVAAPQPAPEPIAAPQPEPTPAPAPPQQPQVSEPVTVATTAPPSLPEDLAPLPEDATPQTRALAERARAGDAVAQHDLANRYATGDGVSQNNSDAAYWYRLAGEAGIANAQYNLGVLTTRGLGVRQDQEAAFQLFRSAAQAGHADAQTATGLAYMHGVGVTQDRLQAASWFQAASANGRPRGAYHLGQLFELGLDEAPDLAAAAGWYRIAADAGYEQAQVALDRLTAAARAEPAPPPAPAPVAAPATTPDPVPPQATTPAVAPSDLVREIQQLLNGFGYDAGPEDGMMGRKTEDAIRAFERSQGFYVTGEATNGIRDVLRLLAEDG